MIVFPNAKINVGLNIVERRPDGYHNIETAFYPIALTDALEIVPATGSDASLTCYGNPVDCPAEKNLVMKAFRLMQEQFNLPPVDIHLYKHIPDGAGLGGGSSDAAFAISTLNTLFELKLDKERMASIASQLGADCAFFIYNTPMMATGIGNVFSPIDLDLKGYTLLLIKPAISVPTREAYAQVTPQPAQVPIPEILARPVQQWSGLLVNDFESSVFAQHPELASIKQSLYDAGAIYAAMSGSGSSIFGIFDNNQSASELQQLPLLKHYPTHFILPLNHS